MIRSPFMNVDDCRRFYADEIRFAAGVESPALIQAFATVPREKFLGPPPWRVGSPQKRAMGIMGLGAPAYFETSDARDLYHNVVIAVDSSRNLNNGQPSALAAWIDALTLKSGERAYHLGCGVGYYTAIMAEIVGWDGSVVASEVLPTLAARARENLSHAAWVTVHEGDGAAFDPGSCDGMLINAGVTHPHLPWLRRLREGGRMVLPLTISAGNSGLGQGLMVKITHERGGFSAQVVSPVAIYSCVGSRDPEMEPLLRKALTTGALLKMKSVRLDLHEQTDACLLHRADVCLSSEPPS